MDSADIIASVEVDLSTLNTHVNEVEIDHLTALRVISHCHGALPQLVSGQLVGLDVNGVLEISGSFPYQMEDVNSNGKESEEFKSNMLKCMREVNADHHSVGWYQSSYLGSFLNQSLIEAQFNMQQNISQSVVLIYDPLNVNLGEFPLRIYRLTEKFVNAFKEKKFTAENIKHNDLTTDGLIEQVPLRIRSSLLPAVYANELQSSLNENSTKIPGSQAIEKQLELLTECLDAHSQEQYKWNRYQQNITRQQQAIQHHQYKRRLENQRRAASGQEPLPDEDINALFKPFQEPAQLENLILTKQLNLYCDTISEFSCTSLAKLSGMKKI